MTSKYLIYGLVDPRTGHLRYVGKSVSGTKRAYEHSLPSILKREPHTHKSKWIQQLLDLNMAPGVVVIQSLDEAESLYETKQGWIAYFRSMGCPLTNLTDGGEGCPGRRMSQETKIQISQSLKGHRVFPGSGAPKGNRNARGKRSEAVRQKMSEAQKKRWAMRMV